MNRNQPTNQPQLEPHCIGKIILTGYYDASYNEELPAGWECVPSRFRPAEVSYDSCDDGHSSPMQPHVSLLIPSASLQPDAHPAVLQSAAHSSPTQPVAQRAPLHSAPHRKPTQEAAQ
jgi:hypothetical protein